MTEDSMAEIDRLLDEWNAWDPVVGVAVGVLAARHGITTVEARLILHHRCSDPDAIHEYCDAIVASLGDGTRTREEREKDYAELKADILEGRLE